MNIVFNLIVIGLVGLIAYWWGNQGLFSALLHLLCVIVAGALALGLWEPLVSNFILRGSWFDGYAWGVMLVLVFAVALFGLRFLADKVAPGNVDLPHWANLAFGLPVGAAAGVLTMGILVIGCGFMQSHVEILGYRGYGPTQNGTIAKYGNKSMWLPVHQVTAEFYSWLSVSSMWTPRPMNRYYPQLHWQASLVRCSYDDGQKGEIAMPVDAASVQGFYLSPDNRTAGVSMRFGAGALDFGEQLTLSNAQVRLIGGASGFTQAPVTYPSKWIQDGKLYLYDNFTHYATSTPGRESADITFLFDLPSGFAPRFIQVKGNRYRLPQANELPPSMLAGQVPSSRTVEEIPTGGADISSVIEVSNDARPIMVSANLLPGTMEEKDRMFYQGHGVFYARGAGGLVARNLQIRGIYEPEGTRMVKLDVSRFGPADIFRDTVQEKVAPDDQLRLIDASGNAYSPIGYMYDKATGEYELKLVPGEYLRTFDQIPYLPTSGTHTLDLYFRVTEGVTIVAFKYGDLTIGTCNLPVPAKP